MKYVVLSVFFYFSLFSATVSAQKSSVVQRIGGDYTIEKILKREDGLFEIQFHAKVDSGSFDRLRLVSEHVHIGIREGDSLRISAEVTGKKSEIAEVDQVLVFVPSSQGASVPVWLLSQRARTNELKGAKYLEMHNPLSDYSIF